MLKANLISHLLDFDDLGPLVGAPPKTGPGETAAPKQKPGADSDCAQLLQRVKAEGVKTIPKK